MITALYYALYTITDHEYWDVFLSVVFFPYVRIFPYKLEYCNAQKLKGRKPTVHDILLILIYNYII